jgi:hypothetical protein
MYRRGSPRSEGQGFFTGLQGGPLCDTCGSCNTLRQIDFECDEPTRFRGTLALRLRPLGGVCYGRKRDAGYYS